MYTLRERAQRSYPTTKLVCFTRKYLAPTLRKRFSLTVNEPNAIDDDILLINGTLVLNEDSRQFIKRKQVLNTMYMQSGRIAYAHLAQDTAREHANELCRSLTSQSFVKLAKKCKQIKTKNLPLLTYPWELINQNTELIKEDYATLGEKQSEGTIDNRAAIYGKETDVYIGKGSFVEAHVTLDAKDGPIYIGKDTRIHTGSRITGPT
jgi:hypothetical protein